MQPADGKKGSLQETLPEGLSMEQKGSVYIAKSRLSTLERGWNGETV